jgi:hypothetical protein
MKKSIQNLNTVAVSTGGASVNFDNYPLINGHYGITTDQISSMPTGTVVASACTSLEGYIPCNHAAVSRTAYLSLFGVIGTKNGIGDGVTTFNLPMTSPFNIYITELFWADARSWWGICVSPAGDIYASVVSGDIYFCAHGSESFVPLGQTSRTYRGMCCDLNGNIYVVVGNGDIYKRTNGEADFAGVGTTSRAWYDICASPNGDIYATGQSLDVYIMPNGSTVFSPVGAGTGSKYAIGSDADGNIYYGAYRGDIYVKQNGAATFIQSGQASALGISSVEWYGIDGLLNNISRRIFFSSVNYGQYTVPAPGSRQVIQRLFGYQGAPSSISARNIACAPDGTLYLAVSNVGIYRIKTPNYFIKF